MLTDKKERFYYVLNFKHKRTSLESMRVDYESQTEFNINGNLEQIVTGNILP